MRTFIAIDLPGQLRKKIVIASRRITKGLDIKLVEEENLHLTLLFLGEIDEKEKERVLGVLGDLRSASWRGGIKLRLGKVEIFPDDKKPSGTWVNVEGEKEKLFSLYKKIVDELLKKGITPEERNLRFSPHITIGRFKDKIRRKELEGEGELEGQKFIVEKISFFQSQLTAKGPKYTKIGQFEVK